MSTQTAAALDPATATNMEALTAALAAQGVGSLQVLYVFDDDAEVHVAFTAAAGDGTPAVFDAEHTVHWQLPGHRPRGRITIRKALARCVRALMAVRGYAEQDGAHGTVHMVVGRSVSLDHHRAITTRH